MGKLLIIVESPTKARTIKKFLPPRYVVKASVGHVRDLPKSRLGVDIEHDFAPKYLTIKGKGDIIKELKAAAKGASEVYLATDPDREGEAIAWHLAEILKLENPKRIELHEITKDAALEALKNPHPIHMDRVNAQQARRILDRLVGYKISPLLWSKVRSGLSAGRVQSVAVKLIVDREREITAFITREYWTIGAIFAKSDGVGGVSEVAFPAELVAIGAEKAEIADGATAGRIVADLQDAVFTVASVKQRETRRNPAAPFTTSTLQQEASRRLRFRVRKTMQVAQSLYEGVDLGSEGTQGLITYMRTDSTRIAESARDAAKAYIHEAYGAEFHDASRAHKLQQGAQDAHEAIRPTSILRTPESLSGFLKRDELKLYRLIWERFVASQMAAAIFDQTTVEIRGQSLSGVAYGLRTTGSVLKFAGFTIVYVEGRDDDAQDALVSPQPMDGRKATDAQDALSAPGGSHVGLDTMSVKPDESPQSEASRTGKPKVMLPQLSGGDALDRKSIDPKQHFTEPPPRFTEATLVRSLEENGIGRPSTYSTIVETIQARGYVAQAERRFAPTEIGIAVNDLLEEHFKEIMNLKYTAGLEHKLDLVEERKEDWVEILREFYVPFERDLQEAERKLPKVEIKDEPTDEMCEKCGLPMVIKTGRFGRFISCTGYPECKTTKPILKDTGATCPKDGGKIVERKSRKGRFFYGCSNYPACDFISWDRVAPEPCPVCGAYVVVKIKRKEPTYQCSADKEHELGTLGGAADGR